MAGPYCSRCGEKIDDHDLDPHTGEPTKCPDKAFTEGGSPDGHVKVMNGERTGRYANGSY
jgi:hypothetical protein